MPEAVSAVDLFKHSSISSLCALCETLVPNTQLLDRHLQNAHEIIDAALCETCDIVFLNNVELEHHTKLDHKNLTSSHCDVCNKTCSSKTALIDHIQLEHDSHPEPQCSAAPSALSTPGAPQHELNLSASLPSLSGLLAHPQHSESEEILSNYSAERLDSWQYKLCN